MRPVLDASITLAFLFSEEITENVHQVWDRVFSAGAWVPALWWLEVGNTLLMAARSGRIDRKFTSAALSDLTSVWIQTDPETEIHAWGATLELAERHNLTVYDAAYLELALRRRNPLATLDIQLREAAQAEGVALLGM